MKKWGLRRKGGAENEASARGNTYMTFALKGRERVIPYKGDFVRMLSAYVV